MYQHLPMYQIYKETDDGPELVVKEFISRLFDAKQIADSLADIIPGHNFIVMYKDQVLYKVYGRGINDEFASCRKN